MKKWMVGLVVCICLMAGAVSAADISVFTATLARAGGAVSFIEKFNNVSAAVTLQPAEVLVTAGEVSCRYRNGAWDGGAALAQQLTEQQAVLRLLGYDPAWAALPAEAVRRDGGTVTVAAAYGSVTVKLDAAGRILSTQTPQRKFTFTYAPNQPAANRVTVQAGGSTLQALRTQMQSGEAAASSGSVFGGFGSLLGFGSSSSSSSATATAGARGLGTEADDASSAVAAPEATAPAEEVATTVTPEDVDAFITEGGLHPPEEPVTAE